jgi:hypothetical protein
MMPAGGTAFRALVLGWLDSSAAAVGPDPGPDTANAQKPERLILRMHLQAHSGTLDAAM